MATVREPGVIGIKQGDDAVEDAMDYLFVTRIFIVGLLVQTLDTIKMTGRENVVK